MSVRKPDDRPPPADLEQIAGHAIANAFWAGVCAGFIAACVVFAITFLLS
jgi:hypothetical protein